MNEEQQVIVAAIKHELERQYVQGSVYHIVDQEGAAIGIEGMLDLKALADAMLSAFSKYHLMG